MIWGVGALFVTEVSNRQWDEDIEDYLVHGTRRLCGEGSGKVYFNKDGLLGAARPLWEAEKHIVLWGDSFLESLNVGDANSVYSQLTTMAQERGLRWRAVAVAQSGRNILDHVRLIPAYSSKIPNITAHLVFVTPEDLLSPVRPLAGLIWLVLLLRPAAFAPFVYFQF